MKTLGIKFQVAGVTEAQASLDSLRSTVNSTLLKNKKAIVKYQSEIARSSDRSGKQTKNLFADVKVSTSKDEFKVEKDKQELLKVWRIPPNNNSPIRKFIRSLIEAGRTKQKQQKNLFADVKVSTGKDELKVEKDKQELLKVWRIPPNNNSPIRKFIRSLIESGRETQERQKNLFKDVKVYTSKNEFKVEKDKQELLRVWRIPPNNNSPIRKFIRSLIESGREKQEQSLNLFKDVKVSTGKDELKVEKDKQELLRVWRIPPNNNSPIRKFIRSLIIQGKEKHQRTENLFADVKVSTGKDEFKVEKDKQELLRVWRIPPNNNSPIRKFIRSLIEAGRTKQKQQKNLFKDVKVSTGKDEFKVEKDSSGSFTQKSLSEGTPKPRVFNFARDPERIVKARFESVAYGVGSFPLKSRPWEASHSKAAAKIKQQTKSIASEIGRELLKETVKSSVRSLLTRPMSDKTSQSEGRSSVYQNSVRIRFTPEALRDLYGVFHGKTVSKGKDKDNRALYRLSSQKEGLLSKIINPIKSRVDYVTSGYFGAIGSHFGGQFAKGLDTVLDEDLDISHERKGRIAGKTYAYFQNGKEENLSKKFETLRQVIVDLNDETKQVDAAQIKKTVAAVTGIPNAFIDSILTGFRRSSIEIEGVRKTGANKANFNEGESIDDLEQYDNAIITASGFAGEKGKQGRIQAQKLREINRDEKTTVFSSDTPFTDVSLNPTDLVSGAAWGVNALANTANINLKGFNPDAIEMVNKVLAMREKNPEIEITLEGHSAGGFVVEEAQYLLELLEVTGTRALTIGTPNLKGGLKPQNIQRIFGENDPLKAIHDGAEYLDFVSEGTELDSVSEGHFFDQYLASENVRNAIFRRAGYAVPDEDAGGEDAGARRTRSVQNPLRGRWGDSPAVVRSDPPRPNPAERAGLIAGDLIVSILESEGDFAARAEVFNNVIREGFNQWGEDLTLYANDFNQSITRSIEESRSAIETALMVVFDLDSLDLTGISRRFQELFRNTLLAPLGQLISPYRQMALSTEGARRAVERSQEILIENRRGTGAAVTSDDHTFVEAIGGLAGERGRSSAWVARQVRNNIEDKEGVRIVSVKNENSDIPGDNQQLNLAGSSIKPMVRGYSPDSVEGAAQALAALARNPEVKIKIVGYSAGGEIAAEIVEILNSLGYGDRVEGIGIGTPYVAGSITPHNYRRVIAPGDPVAEQTEIFGGKTIDNNRISSHNLHDYLPTEPVQTFLNGAPEPLAPQSSSMIRDVSQDYLRNFALGMSRDEKQLDDKEATRLINLIEQFIPVSEPEVVAHLEEAVANFNRFLSFNNNASSAQFEQRQLLNEGTEFLSERLTPQEAIAKRDRLKAKASANRLIAQEQNLNDDQFLIIDEELTRVIEELDKWIKNQSLQTKSKTKDEVVDVYSQHLKTLKANAKEKFKNYQSSETVADFAQLDDTDKKQYIEDITKLIKLRQQEYLKAIELGQTKVALILGQDLIEQTELVRKTYQNLAQSLDANDPIANTIRGNQAYLSSIQTEVIQGQPNLQGRSNISLAEVVGQQVDLAEAGDNSASALIDEILEQLPGLRDAGESIGTELAEGVEDSLEIESPSKVFERIGRFVVSGLRQGLLGIEEPIEDAGETIEGEAEEIERGLMPTIKAFVSGIFEAFPVLGRFKGAIIGVGTALAGMLGLKFAISNLQDLGRESLATAMAVEALNRSILFVSRTPEAGLKNLAFISQTAKEISADLNVAKEAYAGFLGASKNTAIEGAQTDRIFAAFAAAAANRGLDAQSQGRLFTAVEQIISKRYLGAEEVRGQIGDVFPGFEGILSEALGVESSALSQMMTNRELGLDVLPKVAAVLEAQNAGAEGIQTTQMAQTDLNNSLLEFKTLFGSILQPLQKLSFNVLSDSLNLVTDNFGKLLEILRNLAGVVLIALFGQVNVINVAFVVLGKTLNALILGFSRLWAAKLVILAGLAKLAVAYGLVAAAMATVNNVLKLSKNKYQELNDDVLKLTDSMNRYRQAVSEANKEEKKIGQSSTIQLNEGWELPDNWFGKLLKPIVGGDRLNLDNLVRNRWNNMIDRLDAYNRAASGGTAPKLKGKLLSEAERRQADFQSAAGDLNFKTDKVLMDSAPTVDAAKQITDYDREIARIQAKRLEQLPGDKEALEKSLAQERSINVERDKQLKILTNYQQSLSLSASTTKKALDELEAGYANGEFSEDVYKNVKASLLERQDATADKLDEINGILSKVTKTLTEFQRQLRNQNERINNFIERRGLSAQTERTEIISEGIELDKSDRVIQIELDAASRREINDYISELETTIAEGSKRLNSGALSEGYRLVKESAETNGLTLDSATIDRMLAEEERSQAQKDALSELKALRENRTKLGQYQEQLAQNIQANRNSLIDFNRTVSDYFFQINQQIKEAQIEVERIIDQIVNSQIKNQLQAALSPSADSFVNQLISSTQSLLDQAASYAERVLGQKSARIQFATTERSLQMELQDFARNVGGASDALLEFEKRLRGDNSTVPQSRTVNSSNGGDSSTGQSPDSFAGKTKQIAERLGIDPHALMTIMLFESAGTLNPKIQGPNVPGKGRGRGLIQFMPATARGLGTSDTELAGMTDIEQLDYVEKYFAQFKGNFGAGKLENLYAAVLAGNPLKVNASDGYTTARKGAKTMMKDFGGKATELLEASSNDEKVTAATGNKILARRSGQKTPEGMEIIRYDLVKDGQIVDSVINGYSGVKSKQKFDEDENHIAKSLTPPPDGTWSINVSQARSVARGETNNDPGSAVGKYWVGLEPQFATGRSAIGMHLENDILGSAGCLVFTDPSAIRKLTGWVQDNGISDLEVDLGTIASPRSRFGWEASHERWSVPTRFARREPPGSADRTIRTTPVPQSFPDTASSTSLTEKAEVKNNQLIDKQKQKLDLEDLLIQNQEREALEIAIANNLKSDRQKVDFNIVDSQFALDKLLDAGKDLVSQYDFTTAAGEAAKSIRAVNTAFSDRGLQLSREIIKYTGEIKAINDLISQTPSEISMLRGFGMNDEADIIVEKAAQAQLLLKPYEEILEFLTTEYENNVELAKSALNFVNEQNKLKEETERLNKRSLLLTQQGTIVEARGTIEQQRKVKVASEELRLHLEINRIKQENAPGEQRDALINNEREQSDINLDNIDYQSQLDELDLEKKLLDMQSSGSDKNAGFLSNRGFNFEANKLKKDNAIAQENLRFERELVELRKQYTNQPELLEEFTRAATQLNRVNLRSIENEFKSLGKTIEDNFITATQGFFSKFVTEGISFVDQGQKEKQLLEERLRYAEELVQLENQHREEPGKLAHLKNRARELNEEKLDKIRSEFNLFSRTVDMAKQAVMEFVKQLAVMAAQQAAAKFLTSILGNALGNVGGGGVSAVGNDYGSGAGIGLADSTAFGWRNAPAFGAFVADEGITVGQPGGSPGGLRLRGAKSASSSLRRCGATSVRSSARKVNDRSTSMLRRSFPGIASSWNAEGEGAQLGVFHTGEELLSRKTGEAGRYQMLKREYGINPLAKVLNYSEGGTIPDVGSNILSGFSNTRPRIDLGAINIRPRSDRTLGQAGTTVYLSETIYTQDADSFRLNEDQRNQDLIERLRRGI